MQMNESKRKYITFPAESIEHILNGDITQFIRVAKGKNFKVDYVPETFNDRLGANLGNFFYFEKTKTKNKFKETLNFYERSTLDKLSEDIRNNKDFQFNIGDIVYIQGTEIALKIIDGRVEKLQDITYEDLIKETTFRFFNTDEVLFRNSQYKEFIKKWNQKSKSGFKWKDNPFVFINKFVNFI